MVDRFIATPDDKWGLLTKSWATGVNLVEPGEDPLERPETITALKKQCAALGITLQVPNRVTEEEIDWHVSKVDALSIRLPPKEIVDEFEVELRKNGTTYFLPAFYGHAFASTLKLDKNNGDQKAKFQAMRIGDYSVTMCA